MNEQGGQGSSYARVFSVYEKRKKNHYIYIYIYLTQEAQIKTKQKSTVITYKVQHIKNDSFSLKK